MRRQGWGLLIVLVISCPVQAQTTWPSPPSATSPPARFSGGQDYTAMPRTAQPPDSNGRTGPTSSPVMPPLNPLTEPLPKVVPFDSNSTDLLYIDNHWQLVAGSVVVKDFGPYESAGQDALRVVRELRLNQRGTIGSPQPILEFWLSDGQAPHGVTIGLTVVDLHPDSLRVEQVQGAWCLRDDAHPILFNFGNHSGEARQALAVMQRYGFNQIGFLGENQPAMLVFVASPNGAAPGPGAIPPMPSMSTIRSPLRQPNPLPLGHSQPLTQPPVGHEQQSMGIPSRGGTTSLGAVMPPQHALPTAMTCAPSSSGIVPTSWTQSQSLPGNIQPLPSLAQLVERVPIAARQLRVRSDGNHYKVVLGDYVLADVGTQEKDAQLALGALTYYQCTEQCLIGRPKPVFSYFLASGQPLYGLMNGLSGVPFEPQNLEMRQFGASWFICYGQQMLFACGDKADDAQHILHDIQRYQFDYVCCIGASGPQPLTLLLRTKP